MTFRASTSGPREMQGVLFRNKDRKTEKSPTHSGTCLIHGEELRVVAWVNEAKSGERFFSLRFSPKDETTRHPAGGAPSRSPGEDDGDIPF